MNLVICRNKSFIPERITRSILHVTIIFCHLASPSYHLLLTLHNQVNLGGLRLMLCLHRASVGTLIDIHLLDSQAVLQRMAFLQLNPRVQRPLVMPSKNDARTVQPGHLEFLSSTQRPGKVEHDIRALVIPGSAFILHTICLNKATQSKK